MATEGVAPAIDVAANGIPDALCTLLAWLESPRLFPHLPQNVAWPDANWPEWDCRFLRVARATCERLNVMPLYGPDDGELFERYSVVERIELTGEPEPTADRLRLARIKQLLPRYIVELGEVCPGWAGTLPSVPIRSIRTLKQYLIACSHGWFCDLDRGESPESRISESHLDHAKRDLRNAVRSLKWFDEWHRFQSCADYPRPKEPHETADQIEHYADSLLAWMDQWLAHLDDLLKSTDPGDGARESPHDELVLSKTASAPPLDQDIIDRLNADARAFTVEQPRMMEGDAGKSTDPSINVSLIPAESSLVVPAASEQPESPKPPDPPKPRYLGLDVDLVTHIVRRDGVLRAGRQVEVRLQGQVRWPLFLKMREQCGESMTDQNWKQLPGFNGKDPKGAKRTMRGDLNDALSDLFVKVTADWRLVEVQTP